MEEEVALYSLGKNFRGSREFASLTQIELDLSMPSMPSQQIRSEHV